MKNLFTETDTNEILHRIDKLQPGSPNQWGKMNVAQMLAHCAATLEVATGQKNLKRTFMGKLLGGIFKSSFTSDKPYGKNSPTDEYFKMTDQKNFETEKQKLKDFVQQFYKGGTGKCTTYPHSFFGKLTPEEWSIGMHKHLDHHLKQFGV